MSITAFNVAQIINTKVFDEGKLPICSSVVSIANSNFVFVYKQKERNRRRLGSSTSKVVEQIPND